MPDVEQVKVVFPNETGSETLWADPLPGGKYRLNDIPLWVSGIGLGDEFLAKSVEGDDRPHFDRVTRRSNNWTYRVILLDTELKNAAPEIRDLLAQVQANAQGMTCYEDEYFVYSIPGSIDRSIIDGILKRGDSKYYWEYEVSSSPEESW